MLKTDPQFVDTAAFKSLALRLISLNALNWGAPEGLKAGSFTDMEALLGSLSKSMAPPVPAVPVTKPERVASVP